MELTQIKVTIDREYDLFVNSQEFKTCQHDKEKQAKFLGHALTTMKYSYTHIIALGGGRYKISGHHDLNVDIDLFQAPSFTAKQAFNTWLTNILFKKLFS
ncbi:hypothetical protein [Acinetobacter pittii]|uniref:hypothetical protein n=1 Tax=Acinetobacter pittii TaxID=48296 RepID=UPI000837F479|nr:hypothetical protein [Acinetobacter pittii]MBN6523373.1 hypothetical protein [Acinetobacter pittii]OCY54113.1 hypothetical protein BFR81_02680 [Acinetobacter pittii]